MNARWLITLGTLALAAPAALASPAKAIHKEIVTTNKALTTACGCTVQFSYSDQLDFTAPNGRSLAYAVEKSIEGVGEDAARWCRQGEEFQDKFCLMVRAVEIDADSSTLRPYSIAPARGVVRSYLATKNAKQIRNHGGNWIDYFLKHGKMPERRADDE